VNPLVKRCFQAHKILRVCGRFNTEPDVTTPKNISGVLMRCEAGFQRLGPNARGAAECSPGGCGPRDLVVVRLALGVPRGLRAPGSAVAVASLGHSADCLRTTVLDLGEATRL
jgi:hypothetical protein